MFEGRFQKTLGLYTGGRFLSLSTLEPHKFYLLSLVTCIKKAKQAELRKKFAFL